MQARAQAAAKAGGMQAGEMQAGEMQATLPTNSPSPYAQPSPQA